jgi:organic radical activating enzyme
MTKMKLWLLQPKDNLPDDNPWEPWYDKAFGFVIRAETEMKARKIANKNGGTETGKISYKVYRTGGDPWLDPELSTCIELTPDGKEQLIISDIREA